jgi:uncharacterized protein YbaR (Trm112 family)
MSESQTHFITICPDCSARLKVKREHLGKLLLCKRCSRTFPGKESNGWGGAGAGETAARPAAPPARNGDRLQLVCPGCHAELSVRHTLVGQMIRCKLCDREILVPAPFEGLQASSAARLDVPASERVMEGPAPSASERRNGERAPAPVERDQLRAEVERLAAAQNLLENEMEELKRRLRELERLQQEIASALAGLGLGVTSGR